jgi:hypothetical protein
MHNEANAAFSAELDISYQSLGYLRTVHVNGHAARAGNFIRWPRRSISHLVL